MLNSNIAKRPLSSDVETFENTLTNRFNSAVTQLNGDSEVADARVGYDGTTYGSLHDAITQPISVITDMINSNINGLITPRIIEYEYVNNTNGKFATSSSHWARTEYIPCYNYDYIDISWSSSNNESIYNAFYDENKDFISSFSIKTNENIPVPENAYYFVLSNLYSVLKTTEIHNLYDKKINDLYNKNNIISGDMFITFDWIANGYIDNSNGNAVNYTGWYYSDYYDISNLNILFGYTLDGYTSNNYYNAFYDENKVFISSFTHVDIINIPDNAKYIRVSLKSTDTPYLIMIKTYPINITNLNSYL